MDSTPLDQKDIKLIGSDAKDEIKFQPQQSEKGESPPRKKENFGYPGLSKNNEQEMLSQQSTSMFTEKLKE